MNFEIYNRYFDWINKNVPLPFYDTYVGFLCFSICLAYINKIWKTSKFLVIFTFCQFVFEIIVAHYGAYSKNNHDIYLIFYLLESILLILYFISQVKSIKYTITLLIFLIIIGGFTFENIFDKNDLMNDYSGSVQSFIFIIITIYNFYWLLTNSRIKNLIDSTFFWINSAFLIYFSGKFFVSLFVFEIFGYKNNNGLIDYWAINSISVIINRCLLIVAFYRIIKLENTRFQPI